MRLAVVAMVLVLALGAAGCGAVEDVEREVREGVEVVKEKGRELGREARRIRERIEDRVNEVLAELERAVPQADATTVPPTRAGTGSFQAFMTDSLEDVDRYWERTFAAADLPRPRVRYRWVAEGEGVGTGCDAAADDFAAFYCPVDDTIYVGERLAREVYDNIGDFGVAYVIAHEYAHNVQQELGWFEAGIRFTTVAPFELQADCMAGAWGYAAYREGLLDEGDVEEAVETAYAVGDFDLTNPQHHGTPDERAGAWTRGYETGDPSQCRAYTEG